jgi:hypothetical protein
MRSRFPGVRPGSARAPRRPTHCAKVLPLATVDHLLERAGSPLRAAIFYPGGNDGFVTLLDLKGDRSPHRAANRSPPADKPVVP